MAPEEIRTAVLEILEDIAPDEDLSNLTDAEAFRDQLELDIKRKMILLRGMTIKTIVQSNLVREKNVIWLK